MHNQVYLGKKILLVDDEPSVSRAIRMLLEHEGFKVHVANNGETALALYASDRFDLVITDFSMPGMTGGEMAQVIKSRSPATPVVMCSGNPPKDCSAIDIVIRKPTYLLAIKDAIDRLLVVK